MTQKTLESLSGDLAAFQGCKVDEALELVKEGALLNRVADRLENSTARVRQRIVEINRRLAKFAMALAHAQAATGSATSSGLKELVGRRAISRGTPKMAKAKKRNARKKAAAKTAG